MERQVHDAVGPTPPDFQMRLVLKLCGVLLMILACFVTLILVAPRSVYELMFVPALLAVSLAVVRGKARAVTVISFLVVSGLFALLPIDLCVATGAKKKGVLFLPI